MKNYKCPGNKSALPSCLYRDNLPTSHRQFIRRESAIKGKAKKRIIKAFASNVSDLERLCRWICRCVKTEDYLSIIWINLQSS